ncbi:MAG: class B sortase [Clostridiales bacterium]|nr:class B sortase [Clostridiales bacterium]
MAENENINLNNTDEEKLATEKTASLDDSVANKGEEQAQLVELDENGKTYIDITSQYVNKDDNDNDSRVVSQKKKIRTFNEIFHDFFFSFIPHKGDRAREVIRKIVMDISVVVLVWCAVSFGMLLIERWQETSNEKKIKSFIVDENGDETANEYNKGWNELFAQYPNLEFPEGMNIKYAYLYAVNPELVGWIKISNTNLDVQVVQSEDNDKYLKKDFYGKTSRYGCPYMDYRNNSHYLDDNTIIYGHHMSDGLMFSNLDKYKKLDGYKESPIIQFDTLYDTYYFKIIGAFVTNSKASDDNDYIFNYTVTNFASDEKFMSFVDEIRAKSFFTTGVQVQADDKLLTLSTCSYEFSDARLVVVARMCREGEEPEVDTSTAKTNSSPKLPQAWYDAKGLDNPYADADKWMP